MLYVGDKVGYLTIIETYRKSNDKRGRMYAICICDKDKNIVHRRIDYLEKYANSSYSCGCSKKENFTGKHSGNFKGVGDIPACFFHRIKKNASTKHLMCDITLNYIWNLFLQQNRKCAISNTELYFHSPSLQKNNLYTTASLDRIDSNKGYTEGNVQWVHKDVNQMKWNFTITQFIHYCHTITNRNTIQTQPNYSYLSNLKIPGSCLHKYRYNAQKRNFVFNLSHEELKQIFIKQNGICIYTKQNLEFANVTQKKKGKICTASLDRINSTQNYTLNNIQWIHKDINNMKWDLPEYDFLNWCKIIANNHPIIAIG